jgi:hypothetical protein
MRGGMSGSAVEHPFIVGHVLNHVSAAGKGDQQRNAGPRGNLQLHQQMREADQEATVLEQ